MDAGVRGYIQSGRARVRCPGTSHIFLSSNVSLNDSHPYSVQIHVDRYKHGLYSHTTGDPFLTSIITKDGSSTRFHACERFDRCENVRVNGRESHTPSGHHVVYVNPVNMSTAGWDQYHKQTRSQLARGERVNVLVRAAYLYRVVREG